MICIGCGCDEQHACTLPGGDPCAWIHPGPRQLAGICTACVELFPPSIIDSELEICEAAIAAAMDDGVENIEDAFRGNRERILEAVAADSLDRAINGTADPALGPPIGLVESMERDRAELQARLDRAPPRLILPGDEEFHL